MSFGGYKFKGYKVVRANLANNTYANWCLLVHQARIKAFMESCTLSGAQWHFSKTNGALSFESYGNVIYRVANGNGEYHDYLSFFKYGTEELYYMIATLGEYYFNSTQGTPAKYASSEYQFQGGSTTAGLYKYAGYASALSLQEFSDLGCFGTYPTRALPCTSQKGSGAVNTFTNGVKQNTSGFTISTSNTIYVGYATKNKDIITIGHNGWNGACVESGDAFSSLCDPSDNYRLAKINLGFFNSESSYYTPTNAECLDGWTNECLDTEGRRSNRLTSTSSSYNNVLALVPSALPYFYSGGQNIPYGSVYLSSLSTNSNMVKLSTENLLVKGVINNELLSVNNFEYTAMNFQPALGTTVMGGNLLTVMCVCKMSTQISPSLGRIHHGYTIAGTGSPEPYGSNNMYPVAYVGWDASNPDINNDDSWPELALS
jgi:hypothetical protein